ncbi:MAG: carbohydrate ABC transporter permease [Clostridia bacterium]|nr:carbohydrate ABC transporter permease [Clostridia bacterium]
MKKKLRTRRNSSLEGAILEAFSFVSAIVILLPIVWTAFVSFRPEFSTFGNVFSYFTPPYTLDNYVTIFSKSKVFRWILNSFIVTGSVTGLTVLLCALAAYPMAKMKFFGKRFLSTYLLIGLMVPTEATIVSLYTLVKDMSMLNSYAGLIVPVLAGSMNVIITINFFSGIPDELLEAAKIDGASEWQIFTHVILPLGKTVMISVAIFTFIRNWNNFLWPFLCAMNEDMFTLTVGIPAFISTYNDTLAMPMTVSMVASIPLFLFYMIFEKRIVRGIALTGVKG